MRVVVLKGNKTRVHEDQAAKVMQGRSLTNAQLEDKKSRALVLVWKGY